MPSISLSSCRSSPAAAAAAAAIKTVVVPTPPLDYVSLFRSAVCSFSCRQKILSLPPFSKVLRSDSAAYTALRMLRLLIRPSTASYNSLINSLLLANRTRQLLRSSVRFSPLALASNTLPSPSY
ncbi:hypothetical protein HPP92_003438 [Vanilla planifolia]|uniref:Uncharacterized protein n=1 Tax=Vanilla planifolia TaxID=51239 RepID=A0A835VNM9_VANPL|nr:hypothetical protein HPP92_003438 [Vanilla planifolia]